MTLKCRKKIRGQEVSNAFTLKTMYDQDCIAVEVGDEIWRLSAKSILQMMNEFVFDVEKKRKYTYLTNPEPMFDEYGLRTDALSGKGSE